MIYYEFEFLKCDLFITTYLPVINDYFKKDKIKYLPSLLIQMQFVLI